MKTSIGRIGSLAVLLLLLSSTVLAQKFAYVNTQYILSNIPEYAEKKQQLDQISAEWQLQIEERYAQIEKMKNDLKAEEILLPEAALKKRKEEIKQKEEEAKELQRQRFGYKGDLFAKRQELIKPLQDKVYNAVKELADARSYMVIFDKASGNNAMLYTNPKYDVSDEVLKRMGYKPGGNSD